MNGALKRVNNSLLKAGAGLEVLFYYICAGPFRPNYKLVNCSGAEGICSTYYYLLTHSPKIGCQLTYGCGLTHSVYYAFELHQGIIVGLEAILLYKERNEYTIHIEHQIVGIGTVEHVVIEKQTNLSFYAVHLA